MVADVAIHAPVPEKGDHPKNHHAHIMLTLRQATAQGLRAVKTREWNSDTLLVQWSALWAEHQNRALARAGHQARVDHRSLLAQCIDAKRRGDLALAIALDRKPELHVGPKAQNAKQHRRTAPSRDRVVGPRRRKETVAPQRRVVRYTRIDRGSRAEVNLQRITLNVARLTYILRSYQALAGRQRIQWRGPPPPAAVIARILQPRAPDMRPTHPLLRRASEPPGFQVRSKIEPVDMARTIARLHRAHSAQVRRRHEFMRRVWGRDHDLLRLRGRVRARRPSGRPTSGPGSA
jgi:hypothetical protein